MLFELYSFMLGLHHDARFLHLPEAVRLDAGRAGKIDCFVSKRTAVSSAAARIRRIAAAQTASTRRSSAAQLLGHLERNMGQYAAPLRDMQFVLHELLNVEAEIKNMPKHADLDADTINAGARRSRQVLRRSAVPAQPERRPRRLHATTATAS